MVQQARSLPAPLRHALLLALALLLVVACAPARSQAQAPPEATETVTVEVPESMRSAPFDVERTLRVPEGFAISVHARVGGARFMAVTPDGHLLVSHPGSGKVKLIRVRDSGDPLVTDFATGLQRPHDIVFHTIGETTYVYIAEKNKIARYTYAPGDLTGQNREVVLDGLPDASLPELNGSYGHELKNIALDEDDNLYVSIASTCNACVSDTEADPVRGAIHQYTADGQNGRLFAEGIRNAEGLAFVPGTGELWVVVNNRDNIAYPFHDDWDGDGQDDYGRVMQSYVDNHPPEEFTRVIDGGNYGWPFCNPNPDTATGYDDMPFNRDVQLNADGNRLDCSTADRITQGIQAHSAPLGLTFLQGTAAPEPYRQGAAIGYHGSWNRADRTGYKVAFFPWTGGEPGDEMDLVAGWLHPNGSRWGRPVDVAVGPEGDLFISDDKAGAIYRLTYAPEDASALPAAGQTIWLQSEANGKYVAAKSATAPLIADGSTLGGNDKYEVVDAGTGGSAVCLRSERTSKYVAAERAGAEPLIANRGQCRGWERFVFEGAGEGKVGLRALVNGKYAAAESAGDEPLIANRDWLRGWETFSWGVVEGGNAPATAALEAEQQSAEAGLPTVFALEGNYPNPFSGRTTIRYALPLAADVTLEVYDVLGRRVATPLSAELQQAGFKELAFEARGLSSGVYVVRLRAEGASTGDFAATAKMTVVK